ncbi:MULTISPECIES: hypothetical protein [unclassified Meiothermus]|uniref:hypothetical protein n=1 Tax=unclassified Meiothermus TaxID=370471 RepID=UPI001021F7C2|nr:MULTISPECIES: hypothetical protein [unclassified Meiothermus]RYM38991.1 hypothetical protein EWH23_04475 [Meiothermus sp. PNK-Is4]
MNPSRMLDDLKATVLRMEQRLDALQDVRIEELMRAYRELVPRFERDLEDERDRLLSRGAALMLVQQVWKGRQ